MYLTIKEISSDILETQARLEQKHYLIKLRNKHHQNIINPRVRGWCPRPRQGKTFGLKEHLQRQTQGQLKRDWSFEDNLRSVQWTTLSDHAYLDISLFDKQEGCAISS
ncbi:hypothetical protein MTR_2g061350 [Medicago truncatula]|uniref:Uncharacterized protein n=1 Tax=Medicago truncatula TaxID=3880 RepID=A0A072V8J8_MEDTR|nr:hypothetical protein MTR_2g061350 [Medicago truncatula]